MYAVEARRPASTKAAAAGSPPREASRVKREGEGEGEGGGEGEGEG